MKYTKSFGDWLNVIEKTKNTPKRLMIVRGMLFQGWAKVLHRENMTDNERKILINMIDDYLKGELGW